MQKQLHNHMSDPKKLARMWPDFVNIEKRMGKETPFIMQHVPSQDSFVFDACLGCGATTIGLRLGGMKNVLSNEVDPEMLRMANFEAHDRKVRMMTVSYDWKDLTPDVIKKLGKFDLVTCLGNSLTLIFDHDEQLKVLGNFLALLGPEGALIIDERNYPRILEGRFSQSGEYVYCGDTVTCRPADVSDKHVIMEYEHVPTGSKEYLEMYPFKRWELLGLLHEAGFSRISIFGDYNPFYSVNDTEFFTYVARKG
jgi:SAM-dependent methyltransferase